MAPLLRGEWMSQENRQILKGLLFISPWLIGFLGLTAYPILASLYYSFTYYDVLRPPLWVGLENYWEMFQDETWGKSLWNTIYFVVAGVPALNVVAFLVANLLNTKLKLRPLFRTIFYIPSIVPTVASAMVWLWLLNAQYGVINSLLSDMGLPMIHFLSSETLAKPTLIAINCWASGGATLIYLAALQDVPASLHDAAKVDGATGWHRFWHVTLPMCTPAILFNLLTGMIGAFQYFTFAWILTQGGPNNATEFYALHLYRNAFRYLKMGYGSAMAWFQFLIIVALTAILFRTSARWVYYGGEAE